MKKVITLALALVLALSCMACAATVSVADYAKTIGESVSSTDQQDVEVTADGSDIFITFTYKADTPEGTDLDAMAAAIEGATDDLFAGMPAFSESKSVCPELTSINYEFYTKEGDLITSIAVD